VGFLSKTALKLMNTISELNIGTFVQKNCEKLHLKNCQKYVITLGVRPGAAYGSETFWDVRSRSESGTGPLLSGIRNNA
jgi:hypothetical protein